MTDDDLLAQHHAGSADAFAAIVRRHAGWIAGVARRRVGNDAALADDVVQATFLVLAERSRTLRPGTVLSAWLFRVACNVASRAIRDRQRRARHERQWTMKDRPDEPDEEWAALAPVVDALVEQLRQADREAILLRFYRQQTHAEAGRALGIGEEAARKRVERALERLRDAARRRGIRVGATATFAALLATGLMPSAATAGTVAIATTAATNSGVVGGNAVSLAKGVMAMSKATTIATAAAGAAILLTAGAITLHSGSTTPVAATRSATSAPATASATDDAAIGAQLNKLNAIAKGLIPNYLNGGGDGARRVYPRTLGAFLDPARQPPGTSTPAQLATLFLRPGDRTEVPADAAAAWLDAHPWLELVLADVDVGGWPQARLIDAVAIHTPLDRPFVRKGDGAVVIVTYADGRSEVLPVAQARARIDRTRRSLASPDEDAVVYTMSNLRQVGMMLMQSAVRQQARLPATLGEALEMADGEPGVGPDDRAVVFLTRADLSRIGAANVRHTPEWVDANTSFVYLAGDAKLTQLGGAATATTVMAHTPLDAPLPHARRGPVVLALFVDGHVEALPVADAPATIEASRRALEAAR